MSDRPDLIVVGDVMVDVSVEAGALAPGGDVHGDVRVRPGGAGANAAVWAATEGADVRLYGRVGGDLPGGLLADSLSARGVDARLTIDPEARTGAMLVVREEGDRSMVADRGANARLSAGDLAADLEAEAVLVSGYLLFHPGSEPAAQAALERARARFVAVDGASWPLLQEYGVDRFLEATAPANLLLVNEREAAILGGEEPERLFGAYEHVFVKLGERGALHHSDGRSTSFSTPGGQVVDVTGAGDAFDGVLLAWLARGASVQEALDRACQAGRRVATSADTWPEP
ncbi:MAG: carbohydrate kinase family protein [Actinomycetota bacterium]